MKYKDVISQFNINLKDAVKRDPSLKEQDGFILSDIKGSISLIIQENKINESKDYMLKKGITGLIINMSLGYTKLDVDFLSDFNFIEYLNIVHQPLGDTKAINSLHGLKSLVLYAYFFTEIDFNNFPNLQECSILHWTPNAKNLFNCTKLKILHINSYKKDDLSELNGLKLLEKLRIDNSQLTSLNGLQKLTKLKELNLGLLTKLTSIDNIKDTPSLEKLNIQSCKKIPYDTLWGIKSLRWLNLSDVGNIPTIKGIERLNKLEEVYLVGDTKILDGDLSPLLKLPSLKKVGVAHLSHYKPTSLEIEAKVEKKDLKALLQKYSYRRIYKKILKEITTT